MAGGGDFDKSYRDIEIEQERRLLKRWGFQTTFLNDLCKSPAQNSVEFSESSPTSPGKAGNQNSCQYKKLPASDIAVGQGHCDTEVKVQANQLQNVASTQFGGFCASDVKIVTDQQQNLATAQGQGLYVNDIKVETDLVTSQGQGLCDGEVKVTSDNRYVRITKSGAYNSGQDLSQEMEDLAIANQHSHQDKSDNEANIPTISKVVSSGESVPNLQEKNPQSLLVSDRSLDGAGSNSSLLQSHMPVCDDVDGSASKEFSSRYEQALQCVRDGQFCDSLVFIDAAIETSPSSAQLWVLKAKVMNIMEDPLEALRAVSKVEVTERSSELVTEGLVALRSLRLLATADLWVRRFALPGSSRQANSGSNTHLCEPVCMDNFIAKLGFDDPKANYTSNDHTSIEHKATSDEVEFLTAQGGSGILYSYGNVDSKQEEKIDNINSELVSGILTGDCGCDQNINGDDIKYGYNETSPPLPNNLNKTTDLNEEYEWADIDNNTRRSLENGDHLVSRLNEMGQNLGMDSLLDVQGTSGVQSSNGVKDDEGELMSVFYERLITEKKAPVLVIRETGHGRITLQASRKIHSGDILFREIPEFLEQDIASCNISACANCGLSMAKPEEVFTLSELATPKLKKAVRKYWRKREITPCDSCRRTVYCSELCRGEAWESHHRAVCPWSPNTSTAMLYDVRKSFREVLANDGSSWQGWWNSQFSPVFISRLLSSIILRRENSPPTEAPSLRQEWLADVMEDLRRKYPLNSPEQPCPSEVVPNMLELTANIFKRSRPARYNLSRQDFDSVYRLLSANHVTFHGTRDPLWQFTNKVLEDKNLHKKIDKYLQGRSPKAKFHGLFPLASCFRHSCKPNVEMSSENDGNRPGIVVKATRDIEAYEELSVCLINGAASKKDRQDTLWKKFGIKCQCIKCQFEGAGPGSCTHCGRWAVPEVGVATALETPTSCAATPTPQSARTHNGAPVSKVNVPTTSSPRLFPHCGRCQRAWYCSSTCQKENWLKGHKQICKRL